jgi:hypothetical protein
VEQLLANADEAAPLSARIEVRETHGGYRAFVRVTSVHGEGRRTLDAPTCVIVAESAALVVAMSVSPTLAATAPSAGRVEESPAAPTSNGGTNAGAATSEPSPDANEGVRPPAPSESEHSAAAARQSSSQTAERGEQDRVDHSAAAGGRPTAGRRFNLSVLGGFDVGTLPSVAPGVGAAIGVSAAELLRFEARGAYWAIQSASFDQSAAGARFELITIGGYACLAPLRVRLELLTCAGVEVAHMAGSGFGGQIVREGSATWWAPSASGVVRLPLARAIALRAALELAVPVVRRSFVFRDAGELHRPSFLAVRGYLGPEALF